MHSIVTSTLLLAAVVTPAAAQVTSLGVTNAGAAVNGGTSAVAYAVNQQVYLVAWEDNGSIRGRFFGTDGVAKGDSFAIASGNPNVTFSLPRASAVNGAEQTSSIFVVSFNMAWACGSFGECQYGPFSSAVATGLLYQSSVTTPLLYGMNISSLPANGGPYWDAIDDVVFNGSERRFLMLWDDRTSAGWFLQARKCYYNGPCDAPVTITGPQASRPAARGAYDWNLNRYLIAWENGSAGTPIQAVRLDAATLQAVGSTLTVQAAAGAAQVTSTYLPERSGFFVTWTESDGRALVIKAQRVASDPAGSSESSTTILSAAGDRSWSIVEYDPISRQVIVVAEASASPGSGTVSLDAMLLDGNGASPGSPFAFSSSQTTIGSMRPTLRSTHGGQLAAAYVTNEGALLERFSVPAASTPGPRFSRLSGFIDYEGPAVGETVSQPYVLPGCAADLMSGSGIGVDAVHVWAYPLVQNTPIVAGPGVFAGSTTTFAAVKLARYGPNFDNCGFRVSIGGLEPGRSYRLEVWARSTLSGVFSVIISIELFMDSGTSDDLRPLGAAASAATSAGVLAYDDKDDVVFHTWAASGNITGQFRTIDGSAAGPAFTVGTSISNLAAAAYSTGTADNLIAVLFTGSASPAATYLQFVRYSAAGGVRVGEPIQISTSGVASARGDVVFNSVSGQFVVAWDEADSVKLRAVSPDGTLPGGVITVASKSTSGSFVTSVYDPRIAHDWRRNRYAAVYTVQTVETSRLYISSMGAYLQRLDVITGQPVDAPVSVAFGTVDSKNLRVIYLPEQERFLVTREYAASPPKYFEIYGSVVPSSPGISFGRPVIARDGFDQGGRADYDPYSRRALAVARGTAPAYGVSTLLTGAIVDDGGRAITPGFVVPSTHAGELTGGPVVKATRDGQFLLAYIAGGTAYLERFTLPKAATTGIRFSRTSASIDAPANGATKTQPFVFGGWAVDFGSTASEAAGIDAVHVWAYPADGGAAAFVGEAKTFQARSDVGDLFGAHYTNSGFNVQVDGLAPGPYTLVAYLRSAVSGSFTHGGSITVNVVAPFSNPDMSLDLPSASATVESPFSVGGWAIDKNAGTGSGIDQIHIWAFPAGGGSGVFVGLPEYGRPRGDIAAAFGAQFQNSGFRLDTATLAPGQYTLMVYARSTVTGTFTISRSADVTVIPRQSHPYMALDGPADGATVSQPILTGGWAIDIGATSGAGVDAIHVWAFPIVNGAPDSSQGQFVAQGMTGGSRSDVAAVYGTQFLTSGYTFLISGLTSGRQYQLVVYARSAVTGTFNQTKAVRITVQ